MVVPGIISSIVSYQVYISVSLISLSPDSDHSRDTRVALHLHNISTPQRQQQFHGVAYRRTKATRQ